MFPNIDLNSIICDVEKRHDILLLIDCTDGNPNGDPDANNFPRMDQQTLEGIITDVCIKRKIRNVLAVDYAHDENRQIYVKHRGILTNEQQKAYDAVDKSTGKNVKHSARAWMCQHYIDIRLFGAVMAGKTVHIPAIRGPIQFQFARSVDPIFHVDHTIYRVARTNPDEQEEKEVPEFPADLFASASQIAVTTAADLEEEPTEVEHGTFGRKPTIPYGLYVTKAYYSPHYAKDTGVTPEDLKAFWESLLRMFELDRAAGRGYMAIRGLYVFSHEDEKGYGNAHAHDLFDQLNIDKRQGVRYPRRFRDYEVNIDHNADIYKGVTLTTLVGKCEPQVN